MACAPPDATSRTSLVITNDRNFKFTALVARCLCCPCRLLLHLSNLVETNIDHIGCQLRRRRQRESQALFNVGELRAGLTRRNGRANPLELGDNHPWLGPLPYDGIAQGNIDCAGGSQRPDQDTSRDADLDGHGAVLHPAFARGLCKGRLVAQIAAVAWSPLAAMFRVDAPGRISSPGHSTADIDGLAAGWLMPEIAPVASEGAITLEADEQPEIRAVTRAALVISPPYVVVQRPPCPRSLSSIDLDFLALNFLINPNICRRRGVQRAAPEPVRRFERQRSDAVGPLSGSVRDDDVIKPADDHVIAYGVRRTCGSFGRGA